MEQEEESIRRALTFIEYKKFNTNYLHKPSKKHQNKYYRIKVSEGLKNPVYHMLRYQKHTQDILTYILGTPKKKITTIYERARTKSMSTTAINYQNKIVNSPKSINQKEKQQILTKTNSIYQSVRSMNEKMQSPKNQLTILDKFNKVVDKYCSYIPDPHDVCDTTKQMNIEDQKLMDLCRSDYFPKKSDISKRARSLIIYRQPKITPKQIHFCKLKTKSIQLKSYKYQNKQYSTHL